MFFILLLLSIIPVLDNFYPICNTLYKEFVKSKYDLIISILKKIYVLEKICLLRLEFKRWKFFHFYGPITILYYSVQVFEYILHKCMYVSSVSMNVLIKKSLHSNVMKRSSTEKN